MVYCAGSMLAVVGARVQIPAREVRTFSVTVSLYDAHLVVSFFSRFSSPLAAKKRKSEVKWEKDEGGEVVKSMKKVRWKEKHGRW